MSDLGLELEQSSSRKPRSRRGLGCLAVLIALAVLVGGGYAVATASMSALRGVFAPPADYDGPGHGKVLFEVEQGDTASEIGRGLVEKDVVKSVGAFVAAAQDEPRSMQIQPGFYQLKKQVPAVDALGVLIDPENMVQTSVTVPEGLRVEQVVKLLAKKTDYSVKQFQAALAKPGRLGLPDYAKGNPEGYLFPATYSFGPDETPMTMLQAMVARWRQAADEADLEAAAQQLGYTPAELMTVASLVESEANRDVDRGKVARVIYNRLESDVTNGLLQIDATVNYALGRDLGLGLTEEDLRVDSPYNTRRYPGLPPGPIESPGDKAIAAAAHPTPGPWVYYVTVNLETGETKFAKDYDQFLKYRKQLQAWCDTSDRC
ncbi:endolytic transglycosylase MltG [Nocardioides mesophilus]|uniref:Endolytic murein transglycosylase n=1 Tax=Nocardioides mesophilus TaxID=433659 RepID=A0A7G9RAA5_9ACTN|nr:endolytic transglycosylase MltG [Nocardioides mesophilus]QNN52530.1 endolytic transglycosylase MltG [Nocardioides mesophilus]